MRLSILLAFLLPSTVQSFTPGVGSRQHVRQAEVRLFQAHENESASTRIFGAIFTAAASFALANNAASAVDSPPMNVTPFASSTTQIAAEIKLLDMSMPTYGDVKGATASVENVESLSKPQDKSGGFDMLRSSKPDDPPKERKTERPKASDRGMDSKYANVKTVDTGFSSYGFN